jgi:hypothetical protein
VKIHSDRLIFDAERLHTEPCLVGTSVAAASGFAHTVLLGSARKLYEFDRIVRFGREIAATDNAAAIRRCFYDYGTFILPRQWMFALRAREYLSL